MVSVSHEQSRPIFPPDCSEYMLEVPKRRLRFDWFLFAIAIGTLLAFGVFVIANTVF